MSSLGDLSALVGQLAERNKESQKVLNCVEGKLAAMDLDLEVWLVKDPLTCHTAVVDGKPHVVAKVIGFGPHGEGQALLVRDIVHAQEADWETRGASSYGTPKPLRESSRELRFLAIGRLDQLVDAITDRARALIRAFDTGRKEQKNC
ncbi:MAG: hypothetical protein JSR62_06640 [Nitrospira sp.]|nr:hypothetical protein [Nitrospira sp.]